MNPVLLPLPILNGSSDELAEHRDALAEHRAAFITRYGKPPGEGTLLRAWLEVAPGLPHWLWVAQGLGHTGRILGLEVCLRAARRVIALMPVPAEPEVCAALDATQEILDCWWAGEDPMTFLRVAALEAAQILERPPAATPVYPSHERYCAGAIARLAAEAATQASDYDDICYYLASDAHAAAQFRHLDGSFAQERAAQRADFMAALDRLESGR